jgi:PST family polysaccharide transporter
MKSRIMPLSALKRSLGNSNTKQTVPTETAPKQAEKSSYGQILKSTAWVGGSSVVNIAIGIVRTKAMAMLLGPAGFGLAGLYMSVASLTQSVAGLGINSSGVRQIAEAAGSGDSARMGRTAAVLRRVSLFLGLLGALLMIVFAVPISRVTFGGDQRALAVGLLSLTVFFNLVSAGQGALIQGTRRISDMAKVGVVGALFGTTLTIPLIYFFREDGVVPSLVAVSAMTLLASWWWSRKIQVERPSLSGVEVRQEASALLKLGVAFMASSLLMMASAYVIRIIVMHKAGLEATGHYQAAWTLGGLYVGMILQSMGADFYPRLTAVANDHPECNRLVNEQARVSMLLAGPGVIATLTFAPLVISLFYDSSFGAAVELLRWICLGIAMRVISWPMGFIIMAKGKQNVIIFCELAWTVVHLGLAWICLERFGLNGAGIAFFGSYAIHLGLNYLIVRRLSGFRWSAGNGQTALAFLTVIAVVFYGFYRLPGVWAACIGTVAAVLSGIYSVRVLVTLGSLSGVYSSNKSFHTPIIAIQSTKGTSDECNDPTVSPAR